MRQFTMIITLLAAGLTGCEHMNNTEKGAVVGTGMGAIAGTAIGAATGNPRTGAAIGALGGALVGSSIGNAEDKKENAAAIRQVTHERDAAAVRLGITDIVTLNQQGTDPDVIINQIRSTGSSFNLSTADIQFLTQQQVPGKVITAMQTARPTAVVVPRQQVIIQEDPVIIERPYYGPYYGRGYYGRPGVYVRYR
ncbi:hypothetical protein BH11PLA2_BH11PLA2_42620 [soil metagenome]